MLRLSVVEFLGRAIPESFLFLFAIYAFSGVKINTKKYILSSLLMSVIFFLVRSLPIHYGVHTIILMIITIGISYSLNKIDIVKSIKSVVLTIIIQCFCEGVNIVFLQYVLNLKIEYVFSNPVIKTLAGLPSLILLFIIVFSWYINLSRRRKLLNV